MSAPESPYLAFVVGLHVATACALLVFFRRDWLRIIGGFFSSIRDLRIRTPDQRLAWLLILATIPVGLSGLLLEHAFRTVLGRPVPAALFLTANGIILYGGERLRRRAPHRVASADDGEGALDAASDRRLSRLGRAEGTFIGAAQVLALLPGISRSGVTMVAGLARGLSHEDAARFSFLLATPVILAAGLLKIPDLAGPLGAGIGGQVLTGSLASAISAYLAVRFLVRYFQTRTLTPFAIYCAVAGLTSFGYLTLR